MDIHKAYEITNALCGRYYANVSWYLRNAFNVSVVHVVDEMLDRCHHVGKHLLGRELYVLDRDEWYRPLCDKVAEILHAHGVDVGGWPVDAD